MLDAIVGIDEQTLDLEFSEAREERRMPSRLDLRSLALTDSMEMPIGMTDNDAFRIIEVIKEREALQTL